MQARQSKYTNAVEHMLAIFASSRSLPFSLRFRDVERFGSEDAVVLQAVEDGRSGKPESPAP